MSKKHPKKDLPTILVVDNPKDQNKLYTEMVEVGEYPQDPRVPLGPKFEDERGNIQNLVFTPVQSVALITSKQGTVRSNHFHRTDWHFLYVISGEMQYFQREVDQPFSDKCLVVKAGEMVFTPPMTVHKTVFIKDTVLLSIAKNVRSYELHAEDTVKEEF